MKTLIIHPEDSSTTFLKRIYEKIEDKTVVTGGVSKIELYEMIKDHDRVMMLGHGSPSGLFAVGDFKTNDPYIIDFQTVPLLREKNNSVFIWCNADMFVDYHKLEGFYSGMFISEVGEARYCGFNNATQEIVDESNFGFCDIIKDYINEDKEVIFENVKKQYGEIAEKNQVALYNNVRLYKR